MKNWNKPLIFLFISGLFLRLLGMINIRLGSGDFAYQWNVAGDIVNKKIFPLLGPTASVNTSLHLGPTYYYLLSIPYLLGKGDYRSAIIFFSLINSLNIVLFYLIGQHFFNKKISLIATALYTFSAYMIAAGNFPWNAYETQSFILLATYFWIKTKKGKYRYLFLPFLLLGIASHLHATPLFLMPVFFLLLPVRKIPWKYWPLTAVVTVIAISPFLLQMRQTLAIFVPHQESCSLIAWIKYHGHGEKCFSQIRNTLFAFRFLSTVLFNTQNYLMIFLTVLMIGFTLLKKNLKQRKLLFTWLAVPIFLFLFYSANIYLHYFLILFPIPFFLFALFLEDLKKKGKWESILSNVLFYSTIIINVIYYLISLSVLRS